MERHGGQDGQPVESLFIWLTQGTACFFFDCFLYSAMAHPSNRTELPGPSLAVSPLPTAAQLEVADGAHFDVVIIGSGAGGGTLARHLAGEPLDSDLQAYVEKRAAPRTLIVNIESAPALAALDEGG